MARCVQSRVIVIEKTRLRALRERCTIPSPSGKSAAPSRMIVTEKARLRALRERRTIPSPSGKSTIRVLRKKVRSECFGKSAVRASRGRFMIPSPSGKSAAQSRVIVTEKARLRVLREKAHDPESVGKKRGSECFGKKYGPSRVIVTEKEGAAPSSVIVTEKYDPESVGKKHGSEQSDRYRKSAVPSASGKSTVRASLGRCMIPSPSRKSAIRVLWKKVRSECFGKKRGSECFGKKRMIPSLSEKSTAQSIPVKVHSSEYFGKDKGLNRSAASRAVYKENLDRERDRYIFLYRQEKYS